MRLNVRGMFVGVNTKLAEYWKNKDGGYRRVFPSRPSLQVVSQKKGEKRGQKKGDIGAFLVVGDQVAVRAPCHESLGEFVMRVELLRGS
jgi:hypothetical protein